MKTTMCRWCGGEMRIDRSPNGLWHEWHCNGCGLEASFDTEAEALAWAQQPIPWLPITNKLMPLEVAIGFNFCKDDITSALGVKTTE